MLTEKQFLSYILIAQLHANGNQIKYVGIAKSHMEVGRKYIYGSREKRLSLFRQEYVKPRAEEERKESRTVSKTEDEDSLGGFRRFNFNFLPDNNR